MIKIEKKTNKISSAISLTVVRYQAQRFNVNGNKRARERERAAHKNRKTTKFEWKKNLGHAQNARGIYEKYFSSKPTLYVLCANQNTVLESC